MRSSPALPKIPFLNGTQARASISNSKSKKKKRRNAWKDEPKWRRRRAVDWSRMDRTRGQRSTEGNGFFSTRFFFLQKDEKSGGWVRGGAGGRGSKFFNTDKLEALRIFCFFFVEAVVKSFPSSLMSAKMMRPRSPNKKKLIHIWGDDKKCAVYAREYALGVEWTGYGLAKRMKLGFLQYLTTLQTPLWLPRDAAVKAL